MKDIKISVRKDKTQRIVELADGTPFIRGESQVFIKTSLCVALGPKDTQIPAYNTSTHAIATFEPETRVTPGKLNGNLEFVPCE